jgi:hypothetical protein
MLDQKLRLHQKIIYYDSSMSNVFQKAKKKM